MNVYNKVNNLFGNNENNQTQKKINKMYGQKPYNPFVNKKTGQVINPYADYQPVIDDSRTNSKVKKWIQDATGLMPTVQTATTEAVTESPQNEYDEGFDASLDTSSLGNLDIATQLPKLSTAQISKIIQTHFGNSPIISASDAEGIYNAQKTTGMSALAILGIGALESGWGTSNIARKTNNMWGYGATNINPEGNAHRYSQMSQGASQFASEFMKTFYNGYGLKSIGAVGSGGGNGNIAYAQDGNGHASTTWAPQVSNIMGKLYNTAKSVGGSTVNRYSARGSSKGQQLVNEAMKHLGTKYVWGGTDPSGFDCSGLMQYAANKVGVHIDRVSQDQFHNGMAVEKGNLQPGDLVFFKGSSGSANAPGHVGMYVGNGKFIQAPKTGDVVKISDLSSRGDYVGARRIV